MILALILFFAPVVATSGEFPERPPGVVDSVSQLYGTSEDRAIARLANESAAVRIYGPLKNFLGEAYAGAWFDDDSEKLVVAITDAELIPWVRVAGAVPVLAQRSLAELEQLQDSIWSHLSSRPNLADSLRSASVDYRTNTIDIYVTPMVVEQVSDAIFAMGWPSHLVTVLPSEARAMLIHNEVRGGEEFFNPDAARGCTIGFALLDDGYLTSGHCGWDKHSVNGYTGHWQGNFTQSTWPPSQDPSENQEDYAWVSVNTNWYVLAEVNGYNDGVFGVLGSNEVPVNSTVCRYGKTTHGPRCGQVLEKNSTLNVGDFTFGTVYLKKLVKTNACAEAGDSGGPFVDAPSLGNAQGMASAIERGTSCSNQNPSENRTYYAPVANAVTDYGVTLLSAAPTASITDFVCPDQSDPLESMYFCSVSYQSQDPTLVYWSSSTGDSSKWDGLFGTCASGTTVSVKVVVSNAMGQDVRTATFPCPTGSGS